jgi:hypothetical protein
MRGYRDLAVDLELEPVCWGNCGLSTARHRRGVVDPFGVAHWANRRMSRRGLRNFLLLVARRDRLADPGFLNTPDLAWAQRYFDEAKAAKWAARLGVRFPIDFSRAERLGVLAKAPKGFARTHAAIWAWASRGAA